MDCLFCNIVNKEIPAELIYEDDAVVAFLDIHPAAPGHTLVLPRLHVPTILELPHEACGEVFYGVQQVTTLLYRTLQSQGFTIGINHGSISGQTVDHLHIHIIPRSADDGGGSIHSVVRNIPKESIQEIAKKIRSFQ